MLRVPPPGCRPPALLDSPASNPAFRTKADVDATVIPSLAEALRAYYELDELNDLASLFGVVLEHDPSEPVKRSWLTIARQLVDRLDYGNNRALLDTLAEQLELRNAAAIAQTNFERRTANELLREPIARVRRALDAEEGQQEITVPAGRTFTAKSQVRDLVATAATGILLVDPYVGAATLDVLRTADVPVRLLTGALPKAIEAGFEPARKEFLAEGRLLEVRRATGLHDRHLVLNDRCWLVGSSLKDAGKKPFHVIEMVDSRSVVIADLEARWAQAEPYR